MAETNRGFDVSGKVALVTGGRRGLGRAMAMGLVRAGVKLAVAAASEDHAELSRQASEACGELLYLPVDLSDRAQRAGLAEKVASHFGRLDILVNCAGMQHRQPAIEFGAGAWDQILSLMLTGVFDLCQQAARVMLAQRPAGGKIVNIASLNAFQGGWTIPAYAAAKHGVVGVTRSLANEWASKGINVNALAPGYFDTEMCAALKADPVREPQISARIPAGRWGQPEDLVGPLLFLCSDAARYVHGHVLVVDGGGWEGEASVAGGGREAKR